ncbi:MAG: hybrid sensor histidine kinase/response regulator [Labilithrix sp.]|nr:hybrid sensor histidine kinase/response regulator [Labilithrix sp.]
MPQRGVTSVDPPVALVAEDDDDFRAAAVAMLTQLGCRVEVAKNGAEAIRSATAVPPDVVLLDITMPMLDGFEVLRILRARLATKRPYIIVASAHDDARSRELAFEAGCDEYLVKSGAAALERAVATFFLKRGDELRPPT